MPVEYDSSEDAVFETKNKRPNIEPDLTVIYTPEFDKPIDEILEVAGKMARGTPETTGATPLDNLITLKQQQDLLNEIIKYTYEIPMGVSMELASYVHETFGNRFVSRASANNDNYTSSLLTRSVYSENPVIQEVIDRAETGFASPAELLVVQKLLGIRSVELACLSHPYGERIRPMLYEMRESVGENVKKMGGELIENPETHYRAKDVILNNVSPKDWAKVYALNNADRLAVAEEYGGVCGVLMTRKREIGFMPDGTIIKERSSFVLRIDEACPVTSSEVQKMIETPNDTDWQENVVLAGNLDTTAAFLLENDQFDVAIPLATTIYAHNREIADLVNRRFAGKANPMHEMRQAAIVAAFGGREVSEQGDMLFVGFEELDTTKLEA